MKSRGRNSELSTDLTPLIDVVFLLLIFFMVTTVFKSDDYALGLTLPQSETGKQANKKESEKFIIELSKNEIAYNGQKVELDELSSLIKPLEKSTQLQLRVEKSVPYQRLVELLDLLSKNKLSNIALVTDKKAN